MLLFVLCLLLLDDIGDGLDPLEKKFRLWQMYYHIVSYYSTLHENKNTHETATGYLQNIILQDIATHCDLLPTIRYHMTILRCLFAARR